MLRLQDIDHTTRCRLGHAGSSSVGSVVQNPYPVAVTDNRWMVSTLGARTSRLFAISLAFAARLPIFTSIPWRASRTPLYPRHEIQSWLRTHSSGHRKARKVPLNRAPTNAAKDAYADGDHCTECESG